MSAVCASGFTTPSRIKLALSGTSKIDSRAIYERYGHKCFVCGLDLSADLQSDVVERLGNLDHTFPAMYLWPLTTENATLLCREHNGEKAEKWPGKYYSFHKLRELVVKTGIDYDLLSAEPHYNPDALNRLRDARFVERLLHKYAMYIDEIIRLRNRIFRAAGFDFFKSYPRISPDWIKKADAALEV